MLIAVFAITAITGTIIFYQSSAVRGAVYGWVQTDWSGGADTGATAAHPGDGTGWTKYYSKDAAISTSTPGEIKLASTTASWTETTNADFDAGTKDSVYATSGSVFLLRPTGVACSASTECIGGYCNASSTCDTCQSFTYESQNYDVVMIGEQCWMAENLNVGVYATSTDTSVTHSDASSTNGIIDKYCYDNDTNNCDTYGGLYDWDEMMEYTTTVPVQGICPSGWHIPTDAEFKVLVEGLATAGCESASGWQCGPAGTALKSGGASGFCAFLSGRRNHTGSFNYLASHGYFWSSSVSGGYAWLRYLGSSESRVYRYTYDQARGFSVRCVKD